MRSPNLSRLPDGRSEPLNRARWRCCCCTPVWPPRRDSDQDDRAAQDSLQPATARALLAPSATHYPSLAGDRRTAFAGRPPRHASSRSRAAGRCHGPAHHSPRTITGTRDHGGPEIQRAAGPGSSWRRVRTLRRRRRAATSTGAVFGKPSRTTSDAMRPAFFVRGRRATWMALDGVEARLRELDQPQIRQRPCRRGSRRTRAGGR